MKTNENVLYEEMMVSDLKDLCLYYGKDDDTFTIYPKKYGHICPFPIIRFNYGELSPSHESLKMVYSDLNVSIYIIGKYLVNVATNHNKESVTDIIVNDINNRLSEKNRVSIEFNNKGQFILKTDKNEKTIECARIISIAQ